MSAPLHPLLVLAVLGAVLALSLLAFWLNVRRWTSLRPWYAIQEWGKLRGFSVKRGEGVTLPDVLASLSAKPHEVAALLDDGTRQLASVRTITDDGRAWEKWNLLVLPLPDAWPPTALRPQRRARTIADLFPMSPLGPASWSERFSSLGHDRAAARLLRHSSADALLPPDVALFLSGRHVVLDFSDRPFDEISLGRILALGQQVAAHLPTLGTADLQPPADTL